MSELKNRGWVAELVAGSSSDVAGWNQFMVKVDLTPDGLNHVKEVGEVVFAYLRMLQASPVEHACCKATKEESDPRIQ